MLVIVKIARVHQSHGVQVRREDIGILIQRPVLDDVLALLPDVQQLTRPGMKIVNLDIERPAPHILIKTVDIRIRLRRLIDRPVPVMTGQQLSQCGLPRADISCNSDMHNTPIFAYPFGKQKDRPVVFLFCNWQIYEKNPRLQKFFHKKSTQHTPNHHCNGVTPPALHIFRRGQAIIRPPVRYSVK